MVVDVVDTPGGLVRHWTVARDDKSETLPDN